MSKIALVHDGFIHTGAAGRVAEAMRESFPHAPVYTNLALPQHRPLNLLAPDTRTAPAQDLPAIGSRYRQHLMVDPFAFENFDFSPYDLILSSSSFGCTKGVRPRSNAIHVCYCHTPVSSPWRGDDSGHATPAMFPMLRRGLHKWDLRASRQPDYFIANSQIVADRIKKRYGREAFVIPPPVDTDRFQPSEDIDDYYLVVSRLLPDKRIDLAIEACNRLERRLLIIGAGPDRARLEKFAGSRTEFLGRLPDPLLSYYTRRCRAVLFPGEADFSVVPLEANAAGRPVIAYRAGGATETVDERVTGIFFDEADSSALATAIEEFESLSWDQFILRRHAGKFDRRVFAFKVLQLLGAIAPSSCADELITSARRLSRNLAKRFWPHLPLIG